jgi:hypothetical protein
MTSAKVEPFQSLLCCMEVKVAPQINENELGSMGLP